MGLFKKEAFRTEIGMTGVPEAILAREKEMCFAIIATITDYDTWNSGPVVLDEIVCARTRLRAQKPERFLLTRIS